MLRHYTLVSGLRISLTQVTGLARMNLEDGGVSYKIHRAGMLFYSLTVIAYSFRSTFFRSTFARTR